MCIKTDLKSLLADPDNGGGSAGGGKKVFTIASQFQSQLDKLVVALEASDLHFVRCLKPNEMKEPLTFDKINLCRQLSYSGVMVRI